MYTSHGACFLRMPALSPPKLDGTKSIDSKRMAKGVLKLLIERCW